MKGYTLDRAEQSRLENMADIFDSFYDALYVRDLEEEEADRSFDAERDSEDE